MSKYLAYRDVARANFDTTELGAFNGQTGCYYRYYDEEGNPLPFVCAIGLCLMDVEIPEDELGSPVSALLNCDVIHTDSKDRLNLIQMVHDYATMRHAQSFRDFVGKTVLDVPGYIDEMLGRLTSGADLTPELYVAVMHRVAEE